MSTALNYDLSSIDRLAGQINDLGRLDKISLLESILAEADTQTRRRLRDEKTSPDGVPWAAWSEAYAETRHGGHSLLMGDGDLDDSLAPVIYLDGSGGEYGSNLPYAAIQQFGGEEIGRPNHPAREYLGFSDENLDDIEAVVDLFMEDHIERVMQ